MGRKRPHPNTTVWLARSGRAQNSQIDLFFEVPNGIVASGFEYFKRATSMPHPRSWSMTDDPGAIAQSPRVSSPMTVHLNWGAAPGVCQVWLWHSCPVPGNSSARQRTVLHSLC